MSIFPDVANGGIVVRTVGGACVPQSEAPNAYCPPSAFVMNCQVTALAEDCTARIMPSQINAIVSELLCLGAALDPNGPWDCNGNCNLATMFQTWASQLVTGITVVTDGTTIDGNGTADDPITLIPGGVVAAICGDEDAAEALVECVLSDDAGNAIVKGTDGKLFASGLVFTVEPITGSGSQADPIGLDIPALISTDAGNIISVGEDGRLFSTVHVGTGLTGTGSVDDPITLTISSISIAAGICANETARDILIGCMISEDPLNKLGIGTDGGLYVASGGAGTGIQDGTVIEFEIAFSRVSNFANEEILSAYVPASDIIIPANFPKSRIVARAATDNVHIYLRKNQVAFAQIFLNVTTGIADWTLVSDYTIEAGSLLEFHADGAIDFSVLAVTVVAYRPIKVA